MKRRFPPTFVLAVTLATLTTVAVLGSAQAQDRVARLIMLRLGPGEDCSVLRGLEAPDSKVLVTQQVVESTETMTFASSHSLSGDAIKATLAANFNTTRDDPFVVAMAQTLLTELTNASFLVQNAMHVRQGGPVTLPVFLPIATPIGSVALTGPQGDVVVLGRFLIYQIDTVNDPSCSTYGDCYRWAVTTYEAQAERALCLAIGYFTR